MILIPLLVFSFRIMEILLRKPVLMSVFRYYINTLKARAHPGLLAAQLADLLAETPEKSEILFARTRNEAPAELSLIDSPPLRSPWLRRKNRGKRSNRSRKTRKARKNEQKRTKKRPASREVGQLASPPHLRLPRRLLTAVAFFILILFDKLNSSAFRFSLLCVAFSAAAACISRVLQLFL